jgi:hypothetical protein
VSVDQVDDEGMCVRHAGAVGMRASSIGKLSDKRLSADKLKQQSILCCGAFYYYLANGPLELAPCLITGY